MGGGSGSTLQRPSASAAASSSAKRTIFSCEEHRPRAAESEQYELELDTIEAAPLPPLIAPVDEATHQTMSEPDFRALMLKMSRAGHKDELRSKLAEYNVEKAGDLKGAARESYIEWLITLAERA